MAQQRTRSSPCTTVFDKMPRVLGGDTTGVRSDTVLFNEGANQLNRLENCSGRRVSSSDYWFESIRVARLFEFVHILHFV
jgi:hypothetical protein